VFKKRPVYFVLSAANPSIYQIEYPMFEKILFPTDFSAYAKKTLDCIAGFPGARDIILFHVVEEARSPRGGGEVGEIFFRIGENFLKEER